MIGIHTTSYLDVIGNVGYSSFGHGLFLVDGNEMGNKI